MLHNNFETKKIKLPEKLKVLVVKYANNNESSKKKMNLENLENLEILSFNYYVIKDLDYLPKKLVKLNIQFSLCECGLNNLPCRLENILIGSYRKQINFLPQSIEKLLMDEFINRNITRFKIFNLGPKLKKLIMHLDDHKYIMKKIPLNLEELKTSIRQIKYIPKNIVKLTISGMGRIQKCDKYGKINVSFKNNKKYKFLEELYFEDLNLPITKYPNFIKKLEFDSNFNQPLRNLPGKIKYLILGSKFNYNVKLLPESLEYLIVGSGFKSVFSKLPEGLKFLILSESYSRPIINIPKSLNVLLFSSNKSIKSEVVNLKKNYCVELRNSFFSNSVKKKNKKEDKTNYRIKYYHKYLNDKINSLSISGTFSKIKYNYLKNSIKKLKIECRELGHTEKKKIKINFINSLKSIEILDTTLMFYNNINKKINNVNLSLSEL